MNNIPLRQTARGQFLPKYALRGLVSVSGRPMGRPTRRPTSWFALKRPFKTARMAGRRWGRHKQIAS